MLVRTSVTIQFLLILLTLAYKFRARKDKEVISKRDKKHSGGWPKGKSRRTSNDFALPKPPVTG